MAEHETVQPPLQKRLDQYYIAGECSVCHYQANVWTINITSDMVWQEPNQMADTTHTGCRPLYFGQDPG